MQQRDGQSAPGALAGDFAPLRARLGMARSCADDPALEGADATYSVDLSRKLAWVHPEQAKARKAIAVPLNDRAMHVVLRHAGTHPSHVFSYLGAPIKQVSTRAWYLALQRAGLEDFRFRDLRHTWASWHIQSGTPLFALQKLGGWEMERTVRRYAHLAADHLAVYVANAQIHGTFLAHQPTLPKPLDEKAFESQ
jgi:site-specific recombinase XerC